MPHITIIRPVKGLEPQLYECLASTFRQTYPRSKLTVNLCVSSEDDPAYPVLEKIVDDFGSSNNGKEGHDVRLLVEEYDPLISGLDGNELGPNPKIRNISRAYREAPADSLIWIMDCNVWIPKDVAGRMVDKLLGLLPGGQTTTPYKLVHQLPLVVDIPPSDGDKNKPTNDDREQSGLFSKVWREGGGRLDEMFMATTHAKFYSAINTVGVAPCVIGKSNMFRKAHLDTYTQPSHNPHLSPADASRGTGVDFFSSYICEDHLISDLLWNAPIPADTTNPTTSSDSKPVARPFGNHALVPGDLAIQPVSLVPVPAYWARRVRWLRVRKWTVLLATLVEPGVESLLCNLYFAYAATTLPFFNSTFHIPQTWGATAALWAAGVTIWMGCDRAVHGRLHSCVSVDTDDHTPFFARGAGGWGKRPLAEWIPAWLGRELLALPIWTWAVLLGTTVTWRGKSFRVRSDMSVVSLDGGSDNVVVGNGSKENGQTRERERDVSGARAGQHQDVPRWEGRPTATHRKSRSYNE